MSTFHRLLLVCLATTTVTVAGCAASPLRVAVPPVAPPACADDCATNRLQHAYQTTCTMVGRTLECVLRDSAVPWREPPRR